MARATLKGLYWDSANEKIVNRTRAGIAPVGATVRAVDNFANDAAAATGGINIGGLYHTAGAVKIRLT